MEEIWKQIDGCNGAFDVSNIGRIRSNDRFVLRKDCGRVFVKGQIIAQHVNTGGYLQVHVMAYGKSLSLRTHRIVALSFIQNPENKREVNHIDGNKLNNRVDNLEWVTPSENITHSYRLGLREPIYLGKSGSLHNKSKAVDMFDMNMNKIKSFGSMREAFRETGIRHIWESCNNKCVHAGGYVWRYSELQKQQL